MTPDYAALAQRLRERYANAAPGGTETTWIAMRDLLAAALALDRLAAVEGALYSLVEEVEESGRWMMTRDEVLVEERHSYDIEVEATKVALATARRALEDSKC